MRSDVDFEALVHEHHAALYRFALSMTRNEADACDIVQETFLRWAERGHQLLDPTRVKSWLFTTLYRETHSRRRRSVRFPQDPIHEVEHDLPEIPPTAANHTDGRLVLDALDRVDEAYRGAVALFYLDDWTYPEIAGILNIPLGTVKSRISRGIGQLQRLMQTSPPQSVSTVVPVSTRPQP
jgi:RNA polymerase sigma-70 factor (ECF subfamily)